MSTPKRRFNLLSLTFIVLFIIIIIYYHYYYYYYYYYYCYLKYARNKDGEEFTI